MNYANSRGSLSASKPESEKLCVLIIGSRAGVTETIQTFQKLRYAEAGSWSPILPVPNSTEVMSILTRHRAID